MRSIYETGHVPGAVFVDLDTELAAPPGGEHGRHPLPDTADFQAAMRRAGVGQGSRVVCYDASDASAAARAWWLLRFHGHPSDGWRCSTAGLPPGSRAATRSTVVAVEVSARRLRRRTRSPSSCRRRCRRLDRPGGCAARRPHRVRYRGEQEPVDPVAGHVPGAVSAPTTGNVDGTGHFLSADELRERFAGIVTGSGPVASYCGQRRARDPPGARARARRDRGGAVRRLVERLDHRPHPARGDRRRARLSRQARPTTVSGGYVTHPFGRR